MTSAPPASPGCEALASKAARKAKHHQGRLVLSPARVLGMSAMSNRPPYVVWESSDEGQTWRIATPVPIIGS